MGDDQGLGAESCVSRQVLRFVVPRSSTKPLTLPSNEVNSCATCLTSSVFFPDLEERGVTLRKYLWDGPLQLYEMWGEPTALVAAAEEIGLCDHPDAELIVSRNMAIHEIPDLLREIPADLLPHVPPRF